MVSIFVRLKSPIALDGMRLYTNFDYFRIQGEWKATYMIRDISIHNYRIFKKLTIDSLSRVTLIVGANNAGKSSLLEALHLMSSEDMKSALFSILRERDEFVSRIPDRRIERTRYEEFPISQLFHGRITKTGSKINVISESEAVQFSMKVVEQYSQQQSLFDLREETGQSERFDVGIDPDERISLLLLEKIRHKGKTEVEKIRIYEDGSIHLPSRYPKAPAAVNGKSSKFLTTNYLGYNELAPLWDNIVLTPREDQVVDALKILEPTIERISFTSNGILIRLSGQSEPIPLGSMGDGIRRILTTVITLVNVGSGALLVDEIDTGLYYSVLVDMWDLIFQTAARQGAQVFATTHSWDCVKAFQQALKVQDKRDIGQLIRLDKCDDRIRVVSYSADELDIAINQGIEVR
jgi:predicted ATP-dependent endonuclease of OLD family